MTDAFLISRRLHIGYKVNGTLNVLRRLPLLKKILPGDIYSKSWIKTIVLIFKVLGEIFSIFFGKIIYLGLMIALPCVLLKQNSISSAPPAGIALNIFFFLTLLGTLIHNPLFDPSDEMYYAVFLMRMNARDYSMSNYIYSLIKDIVGFFIVIAICRAVIPGLEFSSILLILLPLYVAGAKFCVSLFQLFFFRKHGFLFTGDAPKAGKFVWALVVVLLAAAYVPAVFGAVLPENAVIILCALAVPCGAVSLILLLKAPDHRRVLKYVEFKNRGMISADDHTVSEAVKEGYLKKLDSNDLSAGSGKTGCSYFNDIFVKRHRKLLTRTAKRQAVVLAVLFAAACAACVLLPDAAKEINSRLLGVLPIFLFVMYILNRGETITQTLFFNCDSSMLNYNFYRRPDVILGIFTARLKTLVRINLLPSAVIALGLPCVYLLSGGTQRPLEYAVLFVTIIAMSVFFSVHYLTMYYLLQPYTDGLAQRGISYRIVMILTYVVCYACMQIKALRTNSLLFGIIVCVFAAVYVAAALILTYRLAPKTFRLRH